MWWLEFIKATLTLALVYCIFKANPKRSKVAPVYNSPELNDTVGTDFYDEPSPATMVAVGPNVVPISFADGEPRTFEEYGSQAAVVEDLSDTIDAMHGTDLAIAPQMFLGPAGLGKTLLAKVLANELNERAKYVGHRQVYFFEILGYDITKPKQLDDILRKCAQTPGCVLFIDEIHGLSRPIQTKMYNLLVNHSYAFKDQPLRKLPPFTIVGATTDVGMLEPPMQRRWVMRQLERANPSEMAQFITRRASHKTPLTPEALDFIVSRTQHGGAPWEAIRLYSLAEVMAKANAQPTIDADTVRRVCERHGIDELGLDKMDRRCIQAILSQSATRVIGGKAVTTYKCSEDSVVGMAGVDPLQYRDMIRPKLMSRGLVIIRGGQQLTDKAVSTYGKAIV